MVREHIIAAEMMKLEQRLARERAAHVRSASTGSRDPRPEPDERRD
jgi:hypothetical protein